MAYSIDSLEVSDNPIVLFRGIVGSRAYGTQNANSDTDVRGIFVVPSAGYARIIQPPKQVSDEEVMGEGPAPVQAPRAVAVTGGGEGVDVV